MTAMVTGDEYAGRLVSLCSAALSGHGASHVALVAVRDAKGAIRVHALMSHKADRELRTLTTRLVQLASLPPDVPLREVRLKSHERMDTAPKISDRRKRCPKPTGSIVKVAPVTEKRTPRSRGKRKRAGSA